MTMVRTIEEFRQKAQECRAEAETLENPEIRAAMFEIAAEYERLAVRAEAFEERHRLGVSNHASLINWFKQKL